MDHRTSSSAHPWSPKSGTWPGLKDGFWELFKPSSSLDCSCRLAPIGSLIDLPVITFGTTPGHGFRAQTAQDRQLHRVGPT